MSLSPLHSGELSPKLNLRWFAAFLLVQVALLAGSLVLSPFVLYLAVAGLIAAVFAVSVLLYPWIVIPVIVFSTGLDSTGRLFSEQASRFHLTGFHLAFVLAIIAVGANTFLRRRMLFPVFELRGPLILFLGTIAFSLVYSPNQPEATISFIRMASLVLFLYLSQLMVDSRKAVSVVVWSMALASLGGSILGAYQVITGRFHLPVDVIQALGGNVPRATGMFHNPNIFATFLMGGIIPMMAVLLNCPMSLWKRLFFALATVVSLAGVLASFSRSSWLATMLGIVVLLWLSKKLKYLFIFLLVGVVAVLALKEFVPFAGYIFERFMSIFTFIEEYGQVGTTSGTARVMLVMAAMSMFLEHPVLGIGWRGFPMVFSPYAPVGYPHWSLVDECHTVVATVLAELGLVGFVAFAWFIARVLSRGFSALPKMQDPYLRAILIGLLATFVAFQVSQSFNGDIADNTFWFYTGMLFAVIHLDEKGRDGSPADARQTSRAAS
jgi:O-antigen ligase